MNNTCRRGNQPANQRSNCSNHTLSAAEMGISHLYIAMRQWSCMCGDLSRQLMDGSAPLNLHVWSTWSSFGSVGSRGSLPMPSRGCDAGRVGRPNSRAHVDPHVDSNIGMEYGKPNQCCIPLINSKLMYAPTHANNVCGALFSVCIAQRFWKLVVCCALTRPKHMLIKLLAVGRSLDQAYKQGFSRSRCTMQ